MIYAKDQAIDLLNRKIEYARKRRSENKDQDYFISVIVFNSDNITTIYDGPEVDFSKEIMDVMPKKMSIDMRLYDLIGDALSEVQGKVGEADKVHITILSDFHDCVSKKYTMESIGTLIKGLKAKGWMFTYIGICCNTEIEGRSISIKNNLMFRETYLGTRILGVKAGAIIGRIANYLDFLWDKCVQFFQNDFIDPDD